MIAGSANPLLLASAAGAAPSYSIDRSLRFNSSDSAYLSRTPASASNRRTWTWAGWVKRSQIGAQQHIFAAATPSPNNQTYIEFNASNQIALGNADSASVLNSLTTSSVYRDTSAWYHIVVAYDTTAATASDRVKLYVNSSQVTQFASATYPALNYDTHVNNTITHAIGQAGGFGIYFYGGYLADIHFIDGQALDPTSFGEFDTNGIWQPKAYTGTYGTNGFHLDFADNSTAAALGTDTSGAGNNWTVNNISVTAGAGNDSLVDVPTNGTETDTGLGGKVRGNYATLNPLTPGVTGLSNGNLDAASANAYPTIIPGSGNWYYEVNGTGYNWDGALGNWTPRAGSHNFGQRPFSSTAPSGFKALCTANLPAPVVTKPSDLFDVKLYTGNGGMQTISGLGFSPDFLWLKRRDAAANNTLFDIVRGRDSGLFSNATAAELTGSPSTDDLVSFNSAGFTLGPNYNHSINTSSGTYAAWCWDAGSSTVTNTRGSISSQVRANASAGFSIVTYTGNGSNASVGHGLGVAPAFIIAKKRNDTSDWLTSAPGLANPWGGALLLNTTSAFIASSGVWRSTSPSSQVFYIGTADAVNYPLATHVAYCFAPVAGYTSMSSYTGNGSADGPFVFTNMRPRWILIKRTDTTSNWTIIDTAREGYNVDNDPLFPNLSNAEGTTDLADILSNGFKLRSTDASVNASAGTYIYFAVGEAAFSVARAR